MQIFIVLQETLVPKHGSLIHVNIRRRFHGSNNTFHLHEIKEEKRRNLERRYRRIERMKKKRLER
jgi:hypothetical protein